MKQSNALLHLRLGSVPPTACPKEFFPKSVPRSTEVMHYGEDSILDFVVVVLTSNLRRTLSLRTMRHSVTNEENDCAPFSHPTVWIWLLFASLVAVAMWCDGMWMCNFMGRRLF